MKDLTTGTRDLRMLESVVTHPQWKMPEGLFEDLPAMMAEIAFSKVKEIDEYGNEVEKYAYNSRKRSIAARILSHMHQQNINAAPPVQDHNVHVTGDIHATIEQMQKADLSDEELEALAKSAPILERLKANQHDEN